MTRFHSVVYLNAELLTTESNLAEYKCVAAIVLVSSYIVLH